MGKLTQAITGSFGATESLKSSLMKVGTQSSKGIKGLMDTFEDVPVSMEKSIKGFGTLLSMGLRNMDKSFLRATGQIQALDLNIGNFSNVLKFNSNILRLNGRGQADMIQELIKLRKTTGRSPEAIANALGQLQPQVANVAAFVGTEAAAGLQKALGATVGEFMGHEGAIAKMLDTFGGMTMDSRGMRARIGLDPQGGIGQGNDLHEMGNILTAIHSMFAGITDPAKANLLFEVMGMDAGMLHLAKVFMGAGGMAALRRAAAGGGESSEATFSMATQKLANAMERLFKPMSNILTETTTGLTGWLTSNMADLQPLVKGIASYVKTILPSVFMLIISVLVWIGEGIGKIWNYFTKRDEVFDISQSQIGASEAQLTDRVASMMGLGAQRTSFMADVAGVKDWAKRMTTNVPGTEGFATSPAGEYYAQGKEYFTELFKAGKESLGSWITDNVITPFNALKNTVGELFSDGGLFTLEFSEHALQLEGIFNVHVTNFGNMMSTKIAKISDSLRVFAADFLVSLLPVLNSMPFVDANSAIAAARHNILQKGEDEIVQPVGFHSKTGVIKILNDRKGLTGESSQVAWDRGYEAKAISAGASHLGGVPMRGVPENALKWGSPDPIEEWLDTQATPQDFQQLIRQRDRGDDTKLTEEVTELLSRYSDLQLRHLSDDYSYTPETWNAEEAGIKTKTLEELVDIAKDTYQKKLTEEQFRINFLDVLTEVKEFMSSINNRI